MRKTQFKLITPLSLCIMFLLLLSVNIHSSSAEIDQKIYVGGYDNPPKVYMDDNNEYIGIFPDILNYIGDKEGWDIEYITCLWNDCLEKLETNQINIMVDVGYSDEREELYDYNKVPIITNWAMSYSQLGKEYENIEELNGSTVSVLKGSIHTEGENGVKALFNNFQINATFIEVNSYFDVLEAVNNENADFGIVNRLFGMVNEADFENIRRSFLVFNPVNLHFAFNKGTELTSSLITAIDSHLAELKNDLDSKYYDILNTQIIFV